MIIGQNMQVAMGIANIMAITSALLNSSVSFPREVDRNEEANILITYILAKAGKKNGFFYQNFRNDYHNWKEEIDKNQTIPILIRMSIKNGERYCPDKDGAFDDTYTFIRWANEKKKLKSMISFWDTLKGDPTKVIYIDSNRSKSDSNSNLQSK